MPSRPVRSAVVLLLLALAAAPALPARADMEVYRPRHRLAAELLPLAETALGERGRAVLDPGSNALVLMGDPEALARARAVLTELDAARQTVRVHYARRSRAALEAAGVEVRWRAEAGPLRIGNAVGREPGAELRLLGAEGRAEGGLAGSLRVLEGETGRIETGTVVPFETGGRWHRRTQLVDASSGFEVTPRILGDGQVRVALRPYEARPTAEGGLATSGAETVLVLEPGETTVLGGLARRTATDAAGILSGAARAEAEEEQLLLLRVETP